LTQKKKKKTHPSNQNNSLSVPLPLKKKKKPNRQDTKPDQQPDHLLGSPEIPMIS
jgi:hypothetical protein